MPIKICLFLIHVSLAQAFKSPYVFKSSRKLKSAVSHAKKLDSKQLNGESIAEGGKTSEESCFNFKDFKDPNYTYKDEKKSYRFKMNQTNRLVDSFTTRSKFRRMVKFPEEGKEEEDLTLMELIKRLERDPFLLDPLGVMQDAKKQRLLKGRAYAKPEPFQTENIQTPPSLKDLSPPENDDMQTFWISTPARVLSFASAYLIFPYFTRFLDHFVTMPPQQLDEITSKFGPGISILYGTFISLTLSILYRRQQEIQDVVAEETSMLVATVRNLLSLFRDFPVLAQEAGQCAADQIRVLVKGSRGGELLMLIYSDPYARMLELIDCMEENLIGQQKTDLGGKGSLIGTCRDLLTSLYRLRSKRLSSEALALPRTHFFVLRTLTFLIFLSYAVSILPAVDSAGNPPDEARIVFAFLAVIYIIFYSFASDLNNPFDGVYQVRRSSTGAHLLELKWLVANHPDLKSKVDFEEPREYGIASDVVMIRSPGLGDLMFERDEIYPELAGTVATSSEEDSVGE